MSLNRRQFLLAASGWGWAGLWSSARAGGLTPAWSSRLIRLEPLAGQTSPPVVTALALHPGKPLLAIGGDDHAVRVWDLAQQQFVQTMRTHTDWVRSLAYSADGTVLASAGNDRRLILWDADSGTRRSEQQAGGQALFAIGFADGFSQIATVGFADQLRIYDVAHGQLLRTLACPCVDMRAVTISPDGRRIAGGGRNGRIRIWNALTGKIEQEHAMHRQRIRGLAFSADSRHLVSCGEDRRVCLLDLYRGESFALPDTPTKILSMVFCGPSRLATGGSDNLVRIWDLEQQVELERLAGHTGSVAALAYANNLLVSAGYDTTVRLWRPRAEIADPRPLGQPPSTVSRGAVDRSVIKR